MSKSVAEEIGNEKPRLLAKICENEDVANVLIALLGKLVITYRTAGEIRFSPLQVTDNEFRSRISIIENPIIKPPQLAVRNDLRDYMASKNISLAKVLLLNRHVADFFQELVSRMVNYCDFRHIQFKDLKIITGGAFISKDGELVIRVGKDNTNLPIMNL